MTNYILLEGLTLYAFLFITLTIIIIGFIGFVVAIKRDDTVEELRGELLEERSKVIALNRENMRLKLKYGGLKGGEKIDV